ncbi:MAG: DisA protein [Desulfobacteraceae bacterium]|nr:DisA protein [Desulfobacteraceae bacterium]
MNGIISFLTSIRWQDIIDVLLNSYILFRLYILLRGTNVFRVVAGIGLLWVFQRIALGLGLIVTSWAVQGIIAGAALIIIIVFRNEIRNVLQAQNLKALLWGFPKKIERTHVDSIVEGVYELARCKTGALIVIPGKEDTEDTVLGGVNWNGQVSREMLVSIFWNGNPVHDGAAVILGERVTRVGCILPLSIRDDLPAYFGTRHRAAVGLAEKSDAMIIVVSEERGEVIVAHSSKIVPVLDNISLAQLLHEHLGTPIADDLAAKRHRRELVTAAAVCIFCMASVWFSFARGMKTLTSLEVPLEYQNRDSRMQIMSTSANSVRLYLSGSAALLGSMRMEHVRVKLDLRRAVNGKNKFKIGDHNIVLPPGVRLNRIEPASVELVLDMPLTKKVPIQADWVGSLPQGLLIESVMLIPEYCILEGSKEVLNRMSTIYTRKVQLNKLESSGQMRVSLSLDPSLVKLIGKDDLTVIIKYVISRRYDAMELIPDFIP